MDLYHFTTARHGLDAIDRRRLKIATIQNLNDPFELLCADMSDPKFRKEMHVWKASMSARCGMLCFSESWQNPVQWSHYADRHRGICLKFQVAEKMVRKVTYDDARTVEDAAKLIKNRTTDPEAVIRMMSTKFKHWSYEAEWRAYVALRRSDPVTGLYFQTFNDDLKLVEVILGAACEVKRADVVRLDADVDIRNARLGFKKYEVVTQQDQSHWR